MDAAPVRLQRRMGRALAGRRIVVTRAREQAGDLVRALEAVGADVVLAPVIRIEPLEDLGALRTALGNLAAYRWVVFTSQNAVQIVCDCAAAGAFARTAVAAIGTATAAALAARGVKPELVPDEFVGEALADTLAARGGLAGSRVLIPGAAEGRDAVAVGLKAQGAAVEAIPVYRTVAARPDVPAGPIDAVTFTSPSTVRHFVDLVGPDAARSGRFVAVVIGPITARTARELGLADVLEAEPHTASGIVDALVRRFG
jgi:uroporphyrinogen III methyltransferase / synthase